jgi:hypothetical protein
MIRIAWFIEVLCLLMFITGLRSSGQINDAPEKPYRILLDDVLSEKPVYYSRLFSNCQLVPLETNENCLINNIADIKIENDVIYILDRQMFSGRVLMFSMTGQYLSKVDKTGNGPDEYTGFANYDIDQQKKQITVLDLSRKKMIFYDFNGNYKNELRFNYKYSGFTLSKNQIFLYKDPIPRISEDFTNDYILHILDFSGNSLSKLLKTSDTRFLDVPVTKVGSVNFYKYGNDVRFMPSLSDTVYSIKDQTIKPFLIVESKKYKLSENDLLMINNDLRNRGKGQSSSPPLISTIERFTNFESYAENIEWIFFRFKLGMKAFFTFYDKISGKTICSSWLRDDLTNINPNVISMNGNKMIAFISPSRFSAIKKDMIAGKIKVTGENKKILSGISEIDNPVIVILTLNEKTMFQ